MSTSNPFFVNVVANTKFVILYPIRQAFILLFIFNNKNKMIQSDKSDL